MPSVPPVEEWPTTLHELNTFPVEQKEAIYSTLVPDWVFEKYDIDPKTYEAAGHRVIQFRCPQGSRAMEITVRRRATDRDPMLYLNMADTFNNQLMVLLVVVNDLDAPRYNVDIDQQGNLTHFGTSTRNIPAELAAMKAGLSPGQIRKGLRAFRSTVPHFERFIRNMGHDLYLIEPLAYHNAIIFERYGFGYVRGHKEMVWIDKEFQPGGELHKRLTPQNLFRSPDAWKSVRGRSWAIHDGILKHPFTGFQMYKHVGKELSINTVNNVAW